MCLAVRAGRIFGALDGGVTAQQNSSKWPPASTRRSPAGASQRGGWQMERSGRSPRIKRSPGTSAAHKSLLQAVVETGQALDGEANPVLRRLLLLTVLVKYLEDRGVFPGDGWFGRFRKGARSFLDVLQGEEPDEVLKLLETLERKFNGDVFSLPEDTKLTKKALRSFARLVEAKTLGEQRYLWGLYAFDHLPVDIISPLYQRFVRDSTAVYTPPFLAALRLDVSMPYDKLTGRERILDRACGSGVFLVGAFRRLINVARARHEWRNPDVETLKSILRKQIFGVELSRDAVDLTAFSLALAVCD